MTDWWHRVYDEHPYYSRQPTEAEREARDPEVMHRRQAIHAMTMLGERWNDPCPVRSLAGVTRLFEASFGRRPSISDDHERHHPGSADE